MKYFSYHGVFACFHSVTLHESDKNHLHGEDSVAHPNAVTRTEPKRHVSVRVHLLPTVFTEPAHTDRHTNILKTMKSTQFVSVKAVKKNTVLFNVIFSVRHKMYWHWSNTMGQFLLISETFTTNFI